VDGLTVERARLDALLYAPFFIWFWEGWPGHLQGLDRRERQRDRRHSWEWAWGELIVSGVKAFYRGGT